MQVRKVGEDLLRELFTILHAEKILPLTID